MVYFNQLFRLSPQFLKRRKKESEQAAKRIAELDRIFKRTYEDNIAATISHERFLKLSAEYESERTDGKGQVQANCDFCIRAGQSGFYHG